MKSKGRNEEKEGFSKEKKEEVGKKEEEEMREGNIEGK